MLKRIANILKRERIIRNLTYRELADKCGLSATFLCEIEKEKKLPSMKRAIIIANALNIPVSYLMGDVTFKDIKYVIDRDKTLLEQLCKAYNLKRIDN